MPVSSSHILEAILSFVPRAHTQCCVSQQWCGVVHLKCVSVKDEELRSCPSFLLAVAKLLPISEPQSLHVTCVHHLFSLDPFLATVSQTKSLTSVSLWFYYCDLNDELLRQLESVKSLAGLKKLELAFPDGGLTEADVHHLLPESSGSKRLSELLFNFSGCRFGDAGGRHLAVLATLVTLTTVVMFLSGCRLGEETVMVISKLSGLPQLTTLGVVLSSNCLSDLAVQHLSNLYRCPALQNLHLDLTDNDSITAEGFRHLSLLSRTPMLTDLTVVLPKKTVSPEAIETLKASLQKISHLQLVIW